MKWLAAPNERLLHFSFISEGKGVLGKLGCVAE
jgi:hypothetical protein